MSGTIGVVIASIPPRAQMRDEAVLSVQKQRRPADRIVVAIDHDRTGAPANRNQAWRSLDTDWVAFLDDDDLMYPSHLAQLERAAEESGADLVYPWFDVFWRAGVEPFDFLLIDGKTAEGHPFDDEARFTLENAANFIPITVLVRRALLEEIGGFPEPPTPEEANEDWRAWLAMLKVDAKFHHHPARTWAYRWHFAHTMGVASRW